VLPVFGFTGDVKADLRSEQVSGDSLLPAARTFGPELNQGKHIGQFRQCLGIRKGASEKGTLYLSLKPECPLFVLAPAESTMRLAASAGTSPAERKP
jgi:hypothetical protein